MTQIIIPAILSGGAGTRLWPTSTPDKPKQFHTLGGSESLFVETARRLRGTTDTIAFAPPLVLCHADHGGLVGRQLDEASITPTSIVYEPVARNTAAASVIAAALAGEVSPEALVLLAPADHRITDVRAFHNAIERAAPLAQDRIVTFGIKPRNAATGYGYIQPGSAIGDGVFVVESFHEKPNTDRARTYVDAGYAWNSGMFLFHPRILLAEFDACPEVRTYALAAIEKGIREGLVLRLDHDAFAAAPALPLDTAIMERTHRAAVVPCDIGWADIGAWDEIWRLADKDNAGNATQGAVTLMDCANTLVRADGVKVCVAGLDDLIVVATPSAVLVLPRARAQDVKALQALAEQL